MQVTICKVSKAAYKYLQSAVHLYVETESCVLDVSKIECKHLVNKMTNRMSSQIPADRLQLLWQVCLTNI